MGKRTQSLIGTMEGAATVRVYSENPKTPDGYNTFVFRREISRTLRKLTWLPVIDGRENPLPKDVEVGDCKIRYEKAQKKALTHFVVERARTQYGTGKRAIKFFEYGLAKLRLSDGVYLVLGIVGIGVNSRRYYDQHIAAKFKVDSEVTSLQGQSRIGESTFDAIYDNRFRLILQGVDHANAGNCLVGTLKGMVKWNGSPMTLTQMDLSLQGQN